MLYMLYMLYMFQRLNWRYVVCISFVLYIHLYKSYVFQLVKMTPCGHAYGPHKRLHSAGGIHKDHMNMFGSVGLLARTYRKRREL